MARKVQLSELAKNIKKENIIPMIFMNELRWPPLAFCTVCLQDFFWSASPLGPDIISSRHFKIFP